MKKTNCIIARFQIPSLHEGHKYLIEQIRERRNPDNVVILLGVPEVGYTNKNPLTYEMRADMIHSMYPEVGILPVKDINDDEIWSQRVDEALKLFSGVQLYGSRDSFIPYYKGKYKCVVIKELEGFTGTDVRATIKDYNYKTDNSKSFRKGVIHAIENKFPTAYPTVDIAVLKQTGEFTWKQENNFIKTELLLGRKPGKDKYCFVGGFVDPTDTSLEAAASRELSEEVIGLDTHEFKYICSMKVNDSRYIGTKDGIMTSLFVTYKFGGSETAGDDIEEVKWFDLATFDINILTEHHHPLFMKLLNYLK